MPISMATINEFELQSSLLVNEILKKEKQKTTTATTTIARKVANEKKKIT